MANEQAIFELLARYSDMVQDLTWRLRDVVLDKYPQAIEKLYPTIRTIGYLRPQRKDNWLNLPFYIAPFKHWVNLGFNQGMQMADPDGILIGHGQKIRHVQIARVEDVDVDKISRLLAAAWEM